MEWDPKTGSEAPIYTAGSQKRLDGTGGGLFLRRGNPLRLLSRILWIDFFPHAERLLIPCLRSEFLWTLFSWDRETEADLISVPLVNAVLLFPLVWALSHGVIDCLRFF